MNIDLLINTLVDYLNDLKDYDEEAIWKILTNKIPCNSPLLNHPTCQCNSSEFDHVKLIGLLNGYLHHLQGIDENSPKEDRDQAKRIVIRFEPEDLYDFQIYTSDQYDRIKGDEYDDL